MKKTYVTMWLSLVSFTQNDVITASENSYVAWDSEKLGSFGSNNFS